METLREGKIRNNLYAVEDGVEALAFLRRESKYADKPSPDLILLDLNLPKKDGREVLAEIKEDPGLKRIPVVVLTTSEAEQDILSRKSLYSGKRFNSTTSYVFQRLKRWEYIYNCVRPHQALGYRTPLQFLKDNGITPLICLIYSELIHNLDKIKLNIVACVMIISYIVLVMRMSG
jgi:CheY-like chemotaxis protein